MSEPRPTPTADRRPSLLWRLFAVNGAVLGVLAVLLIVSPITISAPIALAEALIVIGGLVVALVTNLVLLRYTLSPLRRFTGVIKRIDPMRPGVRLPAEHRGDADVAALADAFDSMLDRLEDERRGSARRAFAAQEEERVRIARELHDQIGQNLTAASLMTERALREPEQRADLLAEIAETTRETLDDVRRIVRELRPEALDDLGLVNALIALCNRVARQSGARIERRFGGGLPELHPQTELAIYRVAQEALTNALRHAEASLIEVSLAEHDGNVVLSVRDDGRGAGDSEFSGANGGGIRGMRERALIERAEFDVSSADGGGTQVTLSVPVRER